MTRKHFKALAEIVASIEDNKTRWRITAMLVCLLRGVNPRFDPQRFREACNPNDGATA